MIIVIVVVVSALVVAGVVIARKREQARRQELSDFADEMGLAFDPEHDRNRGRTVLTVRDLPEGVVQESPSIRFQVNSNLENIALLP